MYYSLLILTLIITLLAELYVKTTYNNYLKIRNSSNLTGKEVARKILDQNGLHEVKINETYGILSDNYNPRNKTVNLSSEIYNGSSISSLAVAAHECGHAIQDKKKYLFLRIRSSLVPIVNISSYLGYIAIFIGAIASIFELIILGIIFESVILLFEIVTLPVEFDASNRALKELKKGFLTNDENSQAKKVLTAAALTYVASVANSAIQILRLVLMFGRKRN